MRVLFVHPSPLLYSEIYLRLEPLGLELVAESARRSGHECRLLDLQVFDHDALDRELRSFGPEAVGFSLNYLANVPEVIDLAARIKRGRPDSFVFVGGHSASFIADELLEHGSGAIDCVVRGEGEAATPLLLERVAARGRIDDVPGVVTREGAGPPPRFVESLDPLRPARDLISRRGKYFIGVLDPCASIEFTRGCPWDCSFCSAWTFYGRRYRKLAPEAVSDELARIREPHVFVVDDVAFIEADHGAAIAEHVERRGIRKEYYLETRADVLLRNRDLFARWKRLGLHYMFLGIEAIDEEGLRQHRKRTTVDRNLEALEVARALGITVAINLIADPSWDSRRFDVVKEWALSVPEIVHLTVNTPYPGTETWMTESRRLTTRDYRLFDVQHAVLPTAMSLGEFYRKLVETQRILSRKHLGWRALKATLTRAAGLVARGQTNFVRMLWKFDRVYNASRQVAEHRRAVRYEMRLPERGDGVELGGEALYVHRR